MATLAALALVAVAVLTDSRAAARPLGPVPVRLGAGGRDLTVATRTYHLEVDSRSALVRVTLAGDSFVLPALALLGRHRLPPGVHFHSWARQNRLVVSSYRANGSLLEQAVIRPRPRFFTVQFSGSLGDHPSAPATFFSDGSRGLPGALLRYGFAPNPLGRSYASQLLTLVGKLPPFHTAPFAPPPLQLQLRAATGWIGIGLVQVPDATRLGLTPSNGVAVNYPLRLLARVPDRSAGGWVPAPRAARRGREAWLKLPSFVITPAPDVVQGLRAYHSALASLGQAPVARPPGRRPSWWSWPLVDTWGQQNVSGAAGSSPVYTSAWVRHFASTWGHRFGLRHFTVVIDAQWQRHLGEVTPSPRFGGMAGMHRLIASLHQQGLRVLLWWPLWIQQNAERDRLRVDPTALSFGASTGRAMRTALGHGRRQLGADGLKVDWGYLVPDPGASDFARPQLGVGSAALLRYMRVLSSAAWHADPGALVDASAVAPQFGGTEDEIRLYDARRAVTWDWRAAIVSAVDPGFPIDGDGWRLDGAQAVPHIISSAVYGVPAVYYATRWSGGEAISAGLARELGAVLRASLGRGQGQPVALADGGWEYFAGGRLSAETLGDDQGLAVFHFGRGQAGIASVVSAGPRQLRLPLPAGVALGPFRSPRGGSSTRRRGAQLLLQLTPGVIYRATIHQRRSPRARRLAARFPVGALP
ncbi:MAG: hypothetical protein ACREOD_00510 [Candidatus Dormibacteria bacterium]